jgi:oligoendopeptidase F
VPRERGAGSRAGVSVEMSASKKSETPSKPDLGALPEWDLSDLYAGPDDPALQRDLKRAADEADALARDYEGKLDDLMRGEGGGTALGEAISRFEALSDLMGRLYSYAGLYHAVDMTDAARSKFYADVRDKLTQAGTVVVFFELELNRLDDDALETALEARELARFAPWLRDLRKERPHQLDDRIEKLFVETSLTGSGAWRRFYDETVSDLKFEVDGETLSIEPTLNLLLDADGAVRKKGADALAKTFAAHVRTFTLVTNTLAKDKEISDRWHKFDDIADSRHLANRVEREVVDALERSVREAYPRLSHRYYALKAKWLGMDALHYWDRNAPLLEEDRRIVAWDDAKRTVLDAYAGFDAKMAEIAAPFFDKGWIDAPARPGKAPGAFSHPTVPSAHPYVLLNYQGRVRDVMTLAHELGHGVHQVLARGQGALMAPTPLTLAETASVFGEMLTFRSILRSTKDPSARKALIASKVEDMLNTVVRQIAFYTFERRVHTTRREGGELTAEQIGEIWLGVQGESLGSAVRMSEGYENFWCYISHFIRVPFYVYAYAFGDCLVNSLYAVYQNAEEGFAEKYFEMLAAGGSKHHSELLAPFGLDASDPDFWSMGLKVIEGMIDELETL